jgi:hypothetical protein
MCQSPVAGNVPTMFILFSRMKKKRPSCPKIWDERKGRLIQTPILFSGMKKNGKGLVKM